MKHTQGEWIIKHSEHNREFLMIRSSKVPVSKKGTEFSICKVQFQREWQSPYLSGLGRKRDEIQIIEEQAEANAKLIAASPKMLSELQSLDSHFRFMYSNGSLNEILHNHWNSIKELIKQATA